MDKTLSILYNQNILNAKRSSEDKESRKYNKDIQVIKMEKVKANLKEINHEKRRKIRDIDVQIKKKDMALERREKEINDYLSIKRAIDELRKQDQEENRSREMLNYRNEKLKTADRIKPNIQKIEKFKLNKTQFASSIILNKV